MSNCHYWLIGRFCFLIVVFRLTQSPMDAAPFVFKTVTAVSSDTPTTRNQNDGTRLILRDLTIIETDALQFDADEVVDGDGNSYDWDQIHSAVLNDGRQQEFDRLLRDFGVPLFRVRHRLANQDLSSLSEVVEPLYRTQRGNEVTAANRRNRYLLSLAAFRSRLADGNPANALIPFIEACEIRSSQLANELNGIPEIQDVDLSADEVRNQFTPLLPPIWFDVEAARRSGQELNALVAKDLTQSTDGTLIYLASLSLAAGDTESAVEALDELSLRSGHLVETWLPILRVEMEIGKIVKGPATDALRKSHRRLQGPERAVANYLLALQIGDNPDDFDSAILDLLYIPANHGSSLKSLSAAALHQAALISTRGKKIKEADLIKSELLKNYQNTYHGRLQIVK